MIERSDLQKFYGTLNYYKHWVNAFVFTDGVHYLQENGAAWLIDAIASYQTKSWLEKNPELRDFQLWKLVVNPDKSAVLYCKRDEQGVVITQEIEFTDFPLPEFTLYLMGGVLLLPSEE